MKYIEMRGEDLLNAVIKGSEANAHLVANLALLDGVQASMEQYNFTQEQVFDALRFYLDNQEAIDLAREERRKAHDYGTAEEQIERLKRKNIYSEKRFNMTNAERILQAVKHIVRNEGREIFTRAEVYKQITISDFSRPSYDPVFQGMRIDQPGGAPTQREEYRNVFEQVSHGNYRLTSYGQELIDTI